MPSFELLITQTAVKRGISKHLSKREIEVLEHVAEGFSNKQIAELLSITDATVDTHNRTVVRKLRARNMKHAIALAFRKKILK